ncbi:lactate utilization protein [Ectothiorhodosinus mongolicus]|nr:lactate utilization protein [Ectothiorhodosinus mongolicus]
MSGRSAMAENSARDRILADIRAALRTTPADKPPPPAAIARPSFSDNDRFRAFVQRLEAVAGTWEEVAKAADVPKAVAAYAAQHELEKQVAVAPALAHLDWDAAGLKIDTQAPAPARQLGLTEAVCAVAETGTLVLSSSADHPTTLNFLPEYHLVVMHKDSLVTHLEDAWQLMRQHHQVWPRTVNLVTGPSRTADVEQTIQLGAHGPRSLHVLIVA